jgi:hypothetical protein
VALGHADHRAFDFSGARARTLAARASFQEAQNPRGEGACERLLAMVAFDADAFDAAHAHAQVALEIYDKLHDPWGELESRLLLTQIALARSHADVERLMAACDEANPEEAEPRQHRHLTRAWFAQTKDRWSEAVAEIDAARRVYAEQSGAPGSERSPEMAMRTGDHTPHLLARLARLRWDGPALEQIQSWLKQIDAAAQRPAPQG